MATLTIRNLDDAVKNQLRIQGAINGTSMEAEARAILTKALIPEPDNESLASQISKIVKPIGGIEMDLPERTHSSEQRIPKFEE